MLLDLAERHRLAASAQLDDSRQGTLGQFFTPAPAAVLIASVPRLPECGELRVLDPGAGTGMLTAALVSRVLAERPGLSMHVVAVEYDETVLPHLRATLDACAAAGAGRITAEVIAGDYVLSATGLDADERLAGFDLVIQNPPYGKLGTASRHRQAMKAAGVDTPNQYAAFLALSAVALRPGGQLVAITPRSFCNGVYFDAFRRYLLNLLALDRLHLFESRSTVFADSGVLQENVILAGTRDGRRDHVTLSVSVGHLDDVTTRHVPYAEVVHPGDEHRFIRLATDAEDTAIADVMFGLPCGLRDLGIEVSTGRVVDFRCRDALHTTKPAGDGAPLVYPGNLCEGRVEWPRAIGKAQWFVPTGPKDHGLLVPEGWYAIVKRFSTKEERRRIVASVWSPLAHPGPIAFENHLNVFHLNGSGLDEATARGLAVWLNSSLVDRFFRTFSGHTQVNATDLRTLRFPTPETLRDFGRSAASTQDDIDALVLRRMAA